jgi:hypothetical protein
MPAQLSDQDIASYAQQLEAKGATPADIESFVASAKGVPVSTPAPVPDSQSSPTPVASPVKPTPTAGIGGTAADIALQAWGQTVGQAVGALGGPFAILTVPAGGAIGGAAGNALAQRRRMYEGEQTGFKPGQMAGAAVAGLIPGGSLEEAGGMALAGKAAQYAGGNLAATTAEKAIDEGRAPTLGEAALAVGTGAAGAGLSSLLDTGKAAANIEAQKALNSVRDATLEDAQNVGYVIPPSKVNPSMIGSAAESLAGKAAMNQEAGLRNQDVTNALAKQAIGIPIDQPLTPTAIQGVRDEAGKAYQAVAALSPNAQTDLEALKQARFESNAYYKHYQASADPASLKIAQTASQTADQLENSLENHAAQAGQPGLIDNLRNARTTIAKTYQVENALNAADGNVSASSLGQQFDKGRPLTGPLAIIGRFQQAFPTYARDASAIPSPGVSKLKSIASPLLALAGAHEGGAAIGAIGAAVPFLDAPARAAILSKTAQSVFARPNYGYPLADSAAQLARFTAADASNPQENQDQVLAQPSASR